MLHGARVVLEGGEPVGHCRMAGIARLGEQAEVGQLQCPGQSGSFLAPGYCCGLAVTGMGCKQNNQNDVHGCEEGE